MKRSERKIGSVWREKERERHSHTERKGSKEEKLPLGERTKKHKKRHSNL